LITQTGNSYQKNVKKIEPKLTKADLFRNAGPEMKFEPRPDYSGLYFFCAVIATPLLSFMGSATILIGVMMFLAPTEVNSSPLEMFCMYGSYGALSGLVTHLMWAGLTQAKMPLVPKLSITMFGSMTASLIVFVDIAERAIKNLDTQAGLIVVVLCVVPGLMGGLLALCTKTKKFNFMITPYR
jgi:hypothetical protein